MRKKRRAQRVKSAAVAVATIGALAVGLFKTGDYAEAVFVMLFYQTGELFQSVAVHKSRRSISALLDIRPDYANIERDGELERVDPYDVAVGTVITVVEHGTDWCKVDVEGTTGYISTWFMK